MLDILPPAPYSASLFPFRYYHTRLQPPQLILHRTYPHLHILHLSRKLQLIRPCQPVFFIRLNQQDDFCRVDLVIFAEGNGDGFAGRVDGVYAQFF